VTLLLLLFACGTSEPTPKADNEPVSAPSCLAAPGKATPFDVGSEVAGWTVSTADRENPEFARFHWSKGEEVTGVEVRFGTGQVSDWSTASYRLMPAPEQQPPQELMKGMMTRLQAWDTPENTPFVREHIAGVAPCEEAP